MAGVKSKGSKLYVDKTGAFASSVKHIAHLTEIGEIGGSISEIDVTDLDSEGKEYEPGDVDYGELSLSGNFVEADESYTKLKAMFDAGETSFFGIAHPKVPASNMKFKGFVRELKIGARNTEDLLTFSATIRVSGKPTDFTPPSDVLSISKDDNEL